LPATPRGLGCRGDHRGNNAWLFTMRSKPTVPGSDMGSAKPLLVRMEQGEWFNALDFQIEAKGGSHTTLRLMHSGVLMDDWDKPVRRSGPAPTSTAFLGQYWSFSGRQATYIGDSPAGLMVRIHCTPDGFVRLQQALGLDSAAAVGTPSTSHRRNGTIDGVVDYRTTNFIVSEQRSLYRSCPMHSAAGRESSMFLDNRTGRDQAAMARVA